MNIHYRIPSDIFFVLFNIFSCLLFIIKMPHNLITKTEITYINNKLNKVFVLSVNIIYSKSYSISIKLITLSVQPKITIAAITNS